MAVVSGRLALTKRCPIAPQRSECAAHVLRQSGGQVEGLAAERVVKAQRMRVQGLAIDE